MIPDAWRMNGLRQLYCDTNTPSLPDEIRHRFESIDLGEVDEERSRRSFLIYRALVYLRELQISGRQSDINKMVSEANVRLNFSTRPTDHRIYVPSLKAHKASISNFGNAYIKGKVSDKRTSAILLIISAFEIPPNYSPEVNENLLAGFRFVPKSA